MSRRVRWLYAVVTWGSRGPIESAGPYLTRADARGVKRTLDEEEIEEPFGHRHRVTPLYRMVTPGEFDEMMASRPSSLSAVPGTETEPPSVTNE